MNDPALAVEPYRDGVDCWVDLVWRPGVPISVVRSAKVERRKTRYEGLVDFGVVIEKEVVVARLLREAKIPTPGVLAWHRTTDLESEPSWMLLEFVPHTPVDLVSEEFQVELGQITRRIHSIVPCGDDLRTLSPGERWNEWICQRILMRVASAGRYMSIPTLKSVDHALVAALDPHANHPRALLHLDLRAPNLAIRGNRIVGVFDLANAIVGDPYLELARIRGCDLLSPGFLLGYGKEATQLERNGRVLDAYELDLAALLVVVSREEINDEQLHDQMVKRTTTLLERVMA